jgi:putative SOS response-associated peptidase YedK
VVATIGNRTNIAPSTLQPIIRSSPEGQERELVLMRWGLIPAKAADPKSFKTFSTTNARVETILEKTIWKGPFQRSRCLVPLDGFYEWLQRPSLPQPPPIEPGERGLFGDIAPPAETAGAGTRDAKPNRTRDARHCIFALSERVDILDP